MRLDRLPSLPIPLLRPGRKDERPPRRQPDPPEAAIRHGADEPPANDPPDGGDRPNPPDHLDITV